MPLKRLGRPPFLSINDVNDGDVLEVADKPYFVPAEKSKYGKERYCIVVKKSDNHDFGLRTWTLNVTSWNRLLDAFGEEENLWIGKKVRLRKHEEYFLGKQKTVLYGEPYLEPQKRLEA